MCSFIVRYHQHYKEISLKDTYRDQASIFGRLNGGGCSGLGPVRCGCIFGLCSCQPTLVSPGRRSSFKLIPTCNIICLFGNVLNITLVRIFHYWTIIIVL
jgi:hypothetical protein